LVQETVQAIAGQVSSQTITELCSKLVSIPSTSGREERIAYYIHDLMLSLGYDEVIMDEMGNVVGKIAFNPGGRRLLFEAQMDHVGVSDAIEWSFYPYGGTVIDGHICGRGSVDAKGSLAAMIIAGSELKKCSDFLYGELAVACVVNQEVAEGVASSKVYEIFEPDGVVIGEASNLNIKRGQRGRAEIVIEAQGKSAHTSFPLSGVNAAEKMVFLLTFIKQHFLPPRHYLLGDGIMVLTDLSTAPSMGTSVLPDNCVATFDRRLLAGEAESRVVEEVARLISLARDIDPDIQADVKVAEDYVQCFTGKRIKVKHFAPGWFFGENEELIERALRGLHCLDMEPSLSESGFGTNGCFYGGIKGIPTISFGPSKEQLAHTKDERVNIKQLVKATQGYTAIAASYLDAS